MWQSIVHGCPYLCFCCSDLGRELVNNVQCSGRPSRACPASAFCCLLLGTVHCLCSVCRHLHAGGFSMPVCHLPRPGVSSNILKRGCMWACRWCSPPIRLVMSIGLVAFACVGCITAVWWTAALFPDGVAPVGAGHSVLASCSAIVQGSASVTPCMLCM